MKVLIRIKNEGICDDITDLMLCINYYMWLQNISTKGDGSPSATLSSYTLYEVIKVTFW